MLPAGIEAVVFDAVGTLLHAEPSAVQVYAEVARSLGSRHSAEDIAERFADAFGREEDADFRDGLSTSEARELRRWANIVARVLDDVSDPVRCFQKLYQHFALPSAWRCHPEAAAVLAACRERGLRLAVASNYDQRLRSVVAGFPELQNLPLVISSEVGWRKPAPQCFAAMCRSVTAPANKVLYIGDDVRNDYEGARAAGLHTLLYDPDRRHEAAQLETIAHLRELVA